MNLSMTSISFSIEMIPFWIRTKFRQVQVNVTDFNNENWQA